MSRRAIVSCLLGVFLFSCEDRSPEPRAEHPQKKVLSNPEPIKTERVDPCLALILDTEAEEHQPGAPGFEKYRAQILAQSRSVPLVFRRTPESAPGATPRVLALRKILLEGRFPAQQILEVLRKTRGNYEERRQVFLSEGYFYAELPLLALRLSQIIRLDHLYKKTEKLVIERGEREISVTRKDGRYWLPPEPQEDVSKRKHHERLASLLLFDRVRKESELFGEKIHIDFRELQRRIGFSRVAVETITEKRLVVSLSTFGKKSRALLSVSEGIPRLECDFFEETPSDEVEKARKLWLEDQALIDPILSSAHEIIRRRLPFDEPKTEEGQQDGLLRIQFRAAYRRYQSTYEFNGDSYYVFDGYGRPRLPEVCIDFITDSFDWGTGGHWPERGQKRHRVKGAINFSSLGIENPRSIESLAEFASETPEWFDMVRIPREEQVKFRKREQFFGALARDEARYRRGDIVFIYGLRNDGKFHYHSFLIDEKDPVTGIPTVVLANAGPPQARSWEGEMQNAPSRKIVARMRVRREVLIRARQQQKQHPGVPLKAPVRESAEDSPEAPRRLSP